MAVDVRKVLASAIANAENHHNLDVDALVVTEASFGNSIVMKRFVTRARGRSSRIVKALSRSRVDVRGADDAVGESDIGRQPSPIGHLLHITRRGRWEQERGGQECDGE